jgi:nucleoside-diphosphate-sugar epimerase
MNGPRQKRLFCFGFSYSAAALARRLTSFEVLGTHRTDSQGAAERLRELGCEAVPFDAEHRVPERYFHGVTHMLVSVPPDGAGDPVLNAHGKDIAKMNGLEWVGYLSTTGVYGDHGGAWVDEDTPPAPVKARGVWRRDAEQNWLCLGGQHDLPVQVFRLAGIYGPGRNPLVNLKAGTARPIAKPGHVFSRIHVDDLARVLEASMNAPRPGTIYNVCDNEPAEQAEVIAYAAELLGMTPPRPVPFEEADLSPMARSFYADNKRVSNRRIREELGVKLAYPTYREGLKALAKDL